MTELLRNWVLGIVGASVIAAIAHTAAPSGRVKKVLTLVCGLVMMIAMLKPIVGFDHTTFSTRYFELKAEADVFSGELANVNEKLTGRIIEEECAAYILDKGKEFGMENLAVMVNARWSPDGYWYPAGATITTEAGEEGRDRLAYSIEMGLGIPAEELIWRVHDED